MQPYPRKGKGVGNCKEFNLTHLLSISTPKVIREKHETVIWGLLTSSEVIGCSFTDYYFNKSLLRKPPPVPNLFLTPILKLCLLLHWENRISEKKLTKSPATTSTISPASISLCSAFIGISMNDLFIPLWANSSLDTRLKALSPSKGRCGKLILPLSPPSSFPSAKWKIQKCCYFSNFKEEKNKHSLDHTSFPSHHCLIFLHDFVTKLLERTALPTICSPSPPLLCWTHSN